jgi:hypothetical protein
MRSLVLLTLPLVALSLACGGSDGLPTGSWHPDPGGTTSGGTTGGGGQGSNGSTNGSSSSGSTASSGSTSSGGGSTSSGGASSSGASSSGASSSGASSSSSGSSGASSSSGSSMPAVMLNVSVDQGTISSQLMASSTVHVSVAPNGYSGSATLSVASLPTGVTGTFDNATVSLDGSASATATLTLKTADSATPGPANVEVDATAGGMTFKTTIALTVESAITVHIPVGVNNMGGTTSNPVTTAYGPYPIKIAEPVGGISSSNTVDVYFFNDDSVSHEIHASDDQEGFAHDPGSIAPMSQDKLVRHVNTAGSYNFYLHDQGAPITVGLITIQ